MNQYTGYMILPTLAPSTYRGVDRSPFQPELISEDLAPVLPGEGEAASIWAFHAPGWKRATYQLYEDNMVQLPYDSLYLVRSCDAAMQIAELILPHLGNHEVLRITVSSIGDPSPKTGVDTNLVGFDIAYPGGDYYSAIKNGLLLRRSQAGDPLHPFRSDLNASGLFSDPTVAKPFVDAFRRHVTSEASAPFLLYRIEEP